MPDYFLLDAQSQRDLLLTASARIGRDAAVLEKDIWVVRMLGWLFGDRPWGGHLVFKGGTSLSKVHSLIDRFSEDIDLTYDIRQLIPAARGAGADPVPDTRSQADRWTRQARDGLADWVAGEVAPALSRHVGGHALVRAEGADVHVEYRSALTTPNGYLRSGVKLEFGGRATGEPADYADVVCDAAACVDLAAYLPAARVLAMRGERTFWEKATAAHAFCLQQKSPAERFARHWFDLACMYNKGVAARALADHALALKVAEHKAMFFRMKALDGSAVDYVAAVTGKLQLVPAPDVAARLRKTRSHARWRISW